MIRAVILAATIAALITMWTTPAETRWMPGQAEIPLSGLVQTDYCVIMTRVAGKDATGQYQYGWAPMYRPCDQQPDIYREI